jgi:hypothetical protein
MLNRIIVTAAIVAALAGAQTGPPKQTKKQVALWRKVLRIAGISATPAGLKGDDQANPKPGDIWVAGLPGGAAPRPLTRDGGYRSPIFGEGGKSILALRDAELVEIAVSDSAVKRLPAPPELSKLVGRESGPGGRILALTTDQRVGLFAPASAEMEFLTYDRESAEDLATLRSWKNWTRVYDGLTLFVKRQGVSAHAGWTDIFVQQDPAGAVEISHCRGAYCSQPSLSEDRRQVVFIRTEKKNPGN